ncbi:MAG: Clp protease N-terminal domain-containing protein [Omnitrophica WOR_2 bacterium]
MTVGMVPFNPSARRTLLLAHQEAVRSGHSRIAPGHILLGLVQDEGQAGKILQEQGADLESIREIMISQTPASEKASAKPGRIDLLDSTQRMLERVVPLASQNKQTEIGNEQLLLALVELEDQRTQNILAAAGLDRNKIRERLLK